MRHVSIVQRFLSPFEAIRRLLARGRADLVATKSVARETLSELLEAREREIIAREEFRRGIALDDESLAKPGVLRRAADIVDAASRDLNLAAYYWEKLLLSCNIDFDTWKNLEDQIRNTQEIDNAIERAIRNGNYDEVEDLFDKAMENKLKAIKLAKENLAKTLKAAESQANDEDTKQ